MLDGFASFAGRLGAFSWRAGRALLEAWQRWAKHRGSLWREPERLLLDGFVSFGGRLGALGWRAGERLGWKVGSAGLSIGVALGEGLSGLAGGLDSLG